jgi:hypothetical protein
MTTETPPKTKTKIVYHKPDVRIRKMVNRSEGVRINDAVKRAEQNIQNYKATGVANMDEKIEQLVEICARMRVESTAADERKVYLLSNDIFDAAGMFGEPELSEAAYSLCELIGNRSETHPLSWEAVNVHISSMRLLRQSSSASDSATRQAVLEGLRKVTARVLAEAAAAE